MMSRADFFRNAFINRKKFKKNRKVYIVEARVVQINAKSIDVIIKNSEVKGCCSLIDITDFPIVNLGSIFKMNYYYKFIVKGFDDDTRTYVLSYKSLHPEEMKYKVKPTPTSNHYRNLSNFLTKQILIYKNNKLS